MPKCMHIVCKWLMLNRLKKKKVLPELPAALYLALSLAVGHHWCIFQSELNFHIAGLWITDSSRYLACQIFHGYRQFPQITSLIIHTARLSLAWTSTDLPPFSGICQRFIKTSRRVKNRAKIVQCELGIRNCLEDPKKHSNTAKTDNTLEMSIFFKKGNFIMSTYGFSFHCIHS